MSALRELQNYTFVSKYARWIEEKNRRETWKEAVDRVRNMMHRKYEEYDIVGIIDEAYDVMQQKKVLGSQRALQFGGKPIEKTSAKIYNCTASYCDRLRFFQECFWLLLCGSGTGFSVQKHHIDKLPSLYVIRDCPPEKKVFTPKDTIEGWADCLGALLSSYFEKPTEERFAEYRGFDVQFNFRNIRPKGSYLSSGIGKAPGPEPLKIALEKIRTLLDKALNSNLSKLRPIDAYDIVMHSSDAVLSGGVRRSSTICMFSPDDEEMAKSKTGDWLRENPQRARSNNSATLLRNHTSYETFVALMQHTKQCGDPGFIWVDDLDYLVNPCCEVGMYPVDIETGLSGWQACNLSTINCGSVKDADDFYERCRVAAIIGTLQAGFTDFAYLGETSENIIRREALIGVSMTGTMENYEIVINPDIQQKGAEIVKSTNKEIAKLININQAARTTCLKPEGSTSCLLGTSSGIHPHHAKRYIRRVQNNLSETPYQFFKDFNPQATEKSVWSDSGTDENILFPIEVVDGTKTKNQLPAIDMLKIVKSTQQNWVIPGKNPELCTKPWLNHNVSNTIVVKDDEWDDVTQYIYENREHFTGVSLLSASGDKDYAQAPFTAVFTSREIVREYGEAAIWCSGLIDSAIECFGDLWKACTSAINGYEKHEADTIESIDKIKKAKEKQVATTILTQQLNWINKFDRYCVKYFNRDVKRLTYCLKDVHNWKLYSDLVGTFKPVDYSEMLENEDNTKLDEVLSCVGGTCLI